MSEPNIDWEAVAVGMRNRLKVMTRKLGEQQGELRELQVAAAREIGLLDAALNYESKRGTRVPTSAEIIARTDTPEIRGAIDDHPTRHA